MLLGRKSTRLEALRRSCKGWLFSSTRGLTRRLSNVVNGRFFNSLCKFEFQTKRRGSSPGYRNTPVYIRRLMHVPASSDAVRDAMPVFFEMLTQESKPSQKKDCKNAVRVVLGHFIFVYVHPYMDQRPYRPVPHEPDGPRPADTRGQWCRWNGGTPTWPLWKRHVYGRT